LGGWVRVMAEAVRINWRGFVAEIL
jgi:hypothetical protein